MYLSTLFLPGVLQPFVFLSFDVLHQLRYQSYPLQHHVIQVDYHSCYHCHDHQKHHDHQPKYRFRERFRRVFGCGKKKPLVRLVKARNQPNTFCQWPVSNEMYISL